MRRFRWLSLLLAGALAGALLLGASASALRAHRAKAILHYFAKATSQRVTTPSGKKARAPKAGDRLFATVSLYTGDAKHHAANATGSAFEYCTLKKVVNPKHISASCTAAAAVGGSMVESNSTQNVVARVNVFPITGGTGRYLGVKGGSVKTTVVDKAGDANVVIVIL